MRKIKLDILDVSNDYKSDEKYHGWIKEVKAYITPNKEKYQKDNLYYDLQCTPQDYLPCMIRMMKEVEKEGVMIYNVFPIPFRFFKMLCLILNLQGCKNIYNIKHQNKSEQPDIQA